MGEEAPRGRALVTGVGRRVGIAATIADRLRADGWSVVTTGWRRYDDRMTWGADEQPLADHDVDFSDASAPDELFAPSRVTTPPTTCRTARARVPSTGS
jgi:3-oxoacyl-[acyl-carrier protein] reductase